ncbi:MAG: HD domain-containing protein [Candidatus Marinimicrobia bacterium]|nr:HD domain-containing protein [Candidatus Neomarinimicrobiota bacterium]
MSKKIKFKSIKEYENQSEIWSYLLLRSKNLRLTRSSKLYLDIFLSDATGMISGKIWENAKEINDKIDKGMVVGVNAIVEEFNEKKQLNIEKIVEIDENEFEERNFSWELLLPKSKKNTEKLWKNIQKAIEMISNPFLKELVEDIYSENEKDLKIFPASMKLHHAFVGGFLEHIESILRMGLIAIRNYEVDKDLVITGILLHDIGKLIELSGFPNNIYTDAGNFLGHIVLGYSMIQNKIKKIEDFPKELELKIEHIILSHQGKYEYQSPKKPAMPEAIIVHYLDELDSRMNMFQQAIENDIGDNNWTSLSNYFRIPLYKESEKNEEKSSEKKSK